MGNPRTAVVENGVMTRTSPRTVAETVDRLTGLIAARGMKLFADIDQRDEARSVGLELRETRLIIFGNARAGTPVMAAAALAAPDLPLKILVWSDGQRTMVSYTDPAVLASRHRLSPELAAHLSGFVALANSLTTEWPDPWHGDSRT